MTRSHARERLPGWIDAWARSGRLVLLLDFDGTLAPIAPRPELAGLPAATREALERLRPAPGVELAVVSGRALEDVRDRVGIPEIAYAGNHGMEILHGGTRTVHPAAAAARPRLEEVLARLGPLPGRIAGALVEDKGLTLSVHHREVDRPRVPEVRARVVGAVRGIEGLRLTEGKEVLEVRPAVDWDKGRAAGFLLDRLRPPEGAPVLYLGDDRTDEDAFRALAARSGAGRGEGVLVADPPVPSAASCFVRDPGEVAALLRELGSRAPR